MAQTLNEGVYVVELEPVELSEDEHGHRFYYWAKSRTAEVFRRPDGKYELRYREEIWSEAAELAVLETVVLGYDAETRTSLCRLLDCPLEFVISAEVLEAAGIKPDELPVFSLAGDGHVIRTVGPEAEKHGERFCQWVQDNGVRVEISERSDALCELHVYEGLGSWGSIEAMLQSLEPEIVEHREEFGQEVCKFLDCPESFIVSCRVLFGVETKGLPQVWEREGQADG